MVVVVRIAGKNIEDIKLLKKNNQKGVEYVYNI